jgi:hypothetical protein
MRAFMYFDILVPVEQKLVLSVKPNLNSSPARLCHSVPYVLHPTVGLKCHNFQAVTCPRKYRRRP